MDTTMIGVWELEKPLLCQSDVSGRHFTATISGVNVRLNFPSCPEGSSGALMPPDGAPFKKVNWGMVMEMPGSYFSVDNVFVVFPGGEDEARMVYRGFPAWKNRIAKLLLIKSNGYVQPEQEPISLLKSGSFYNGLQLLSLSQNNIKPVPNTFAPVIHLEITPHDQYYSADEITLLLEEAGSIAEIALPYELIVNAYQAVIRNDFRSAVILASAALEEAIIRKIELHFLNEGLPDFEREKNRHKMLGRRFAWLEKLGIVVPVCDYQTSILDVRNETTHEGACPSLEKTKLCLRECNTIIREYCPDILELSR